MATIELHDVSKTFPGGVQALMDVSFTAGPGEVVVLVGPSGCGKTTTLRLIAGLDRPTSRHVRLPGRDPAEAPPQQLGIALVPQRPVLYHHLDIAWNLRFGPGRRAEDIERAIEMLDLSSLLSRRPHELSGGQQQRVALGRAIARRPAFLLLD